MAKAKLSNTETSPRRSFLRKAAIGVVVALAGASALDLLPKVRATTITTTAFQFANSQIYEESATIGDSIRNSTDSAYVNLNALAFRVFATKGDANPTLSLNSSQLQFGVGGASAVDVTISRSAANVLQVDSTFQPSTDNTRALGTSSLRWTNIIASTAHQVFGALGDANPTSSLIGGELDFGPGGAGAVDCSVKRTTGPEIGLLAGVAAVRWDGTAWYPAADNIRDSGRTGNRWRIAYAAGSYQILLAASDANPTSKLGSAQLQFGVGGASAVDVTISRSAANVLQVDSTFQPSTDNTRALGTSALRWTNVIASVAHQVFAAASDANPTATLNGAQIQFGAGAASAVDATISRTAIGQISLPGMRWKTVTQTSTNYTILPGDTIVLVSTGASARTMTLPAASQTGQIIIVKKIDSGAGTVIVSRAGSDTIEGATTKTLAAVQYNELVLYADGGTTWYIKNSIGTIT